MVRRDPDPLLHPELRSPAGHLGDQLPAHHPPEERGDPLERLAPEREPLPPGQRRRAPGHGGDQPGRGGGGEALLPHRREPVSGAGLSLEHERQDGAGRVLLRDPIAPGRGHREHRLRRGGGGRPSGEPDPLPPPLPRAAGLLPGGLRRPLVQLGGSLLQPQDRPGAGAGGAHPVRGPPGRSGGPIRAGLLPDPDGETILESGESDQLWPTEDFTVGRVRRSLFQQSHVGAVYTRTGHGLRPAPGVRYRRRLPRGSAHGRRRLQPLHLPGPGALQRPDRGVHDLPHRPHGEGRALLAGAPVPGISVELSQRRLPPPLLVPGLRPGLGSGGGLRAAAGLPASPAHPHHRAPPPVAVLRSPDSSTSSTSNT
jgi:hypothetical protein